MFSSEQEPLALLIELTPKLAKKRFRDHIYSSWDNSCGYCGSPATSLDHIVPKFKSGSSNRNNLLPCCRSCNANKASTEMEAWFRSQSFFNEDKLDKIKAWTKQEVIDLFAHY